ncbi:RNA polymerase sigma factor FliA [Paracidovorax anthurii]|uniref:RNA polymerase sigma-28 (SigD/FliA/WhiG) subunit n=1 Tax=Paracidovorax anthurii TaxID=78229 RepID=A0A328YUM7_9BURK|nr:RNA polymerase sigma factor FliA [Paracidovorax anthurii]RAR76843.1 RNA polymerase sigma-28 (SigD/FliA/WhiG) subunit [Paracidovorax anthurii]WCM93790.1 RNA polymerase sigma factor FliA [Acidovorax sp. NCPPB 2350]
MQTAYAEFHSVATTVRSVADEARQLRAYAPLVKRVVRQLQAQAGGTMDLDDMEQIGLIGLLEAMRRYGEPDERFGAYAAMRVRGAILDELRRQDWRPRAVRQESHRMRDAVRDITRKLGREPSEQELVQALGVTPEAYRAYLQDENAEQLASFDELILELSNTASDMQSPEAQMIARRSLEQALRVLDEREQRVIQLYYEFELSFKEIAAVLDLTEARICQLNKGALRKMREFLQAH